jgi:hypothetical protein
VVATSVSVKFSLKADQASAQGLSILPLGQAAGGHTAGPTGTIIFTSPTCTRVRRRASCCTCTVLPIRRSPCRRRR